MLYLVGHFTKRWPDLNTPPPHPCLETALRKNRPLDPQSNSRTTFFTIELGFWWFWWMQDSYSPVHDNISAL